MVSQIKPKLGGRHWGWHWDSELLKNICYDIHDGRHSSHLENLLLLAHLELCSRSAYAMVYPSSLCPSVTFHIFDIAIRIVSIITVMAAILKVFNCYLIPNSKSDRVETLWKASGQHGDLELLKWFRSNIQEGHYASHLKNLQITSATERLVWLSLNMRRDIGVFWKFRIAKIVLFQWPPSWILQTTSPPKQ